MPQEQSKQRQCLQVSESARMFVQSTDQRLFRRLLCAAVYSRDEHEAARINTVNRSTCCASYGAACMLLGEASVLDPKLKLRYYLNILLILSCFFLLQYRSLFR